MTQNLSFGEAASRLHEIADFFQEDRFNKKGLLGITVEDRGRLPLKICEADIFDSLVRILLELDAFMIDDSGPCAFGLLQDSFDKDPPPFEQMRRMGNAFLAFRARLGTIPMSWLPRSPESIE